MRRGSAQPVSILLSRPDNPSGPSSFDGQRSWIKVIKLASRHSHNLMLDGSELLLATVMADRTFPAAVTDRQPPMIHALPGMGAGQGMYPSPWDTIPGFRAHNWAPYEGETSLAAVAESMRTFCSIQDGDSLIGSSLGGMVACEITKICRIPVLYLVGSAISKDEISKFLAPFHRFAGLAPINWLRIAAGSIPNEMAQMFSEADPEFVRSMCKAIFEWEGGANAQTQVLRIHGCHDLVIPPPDNPDLLLEGGHLIAHSHPTECSNYIRAKSQSSESLPHVAVP